MHLARFPRVRLFPTPTPLERLANLSKHLGGPEIWIKRDDCTVVATGGNKIRKLEWLVGEALAQGADHLVTQGAVQSNHVRQTAAVAARFGMKCTALLEHRVETNDRDYLNSGNVLLDKLFGCAIEYRPSGLDMNAEAEAKGEALKAEGGKPYVIPGGGSNRVGALGYVSCAQELVQQADEMGLRIDRIVIGHRQRGDPCRAGGRAAGLQRRHPGARHRRAHCRGTGRRRMVHTPGRGDRGLCRRARRYSRGRRWRRTATMSAPATASRPRAWARRC